MDSRERLSAVSPHLRKSSTPSTMVWELAQAEGISLRLAALVVGGDGDAVSPIAAHPAAGGEAAFGIGATGHRGSLGRKPASLGVNRFLRPYWKRPTIAPPMKAAT
jgi:hypothetical protein